MVEKSSAHRGAAPGGGDSGFIRVATTLTVKTSSKGLDFSGVSVFRRCCRPGCGKPAVATLTYAYSESTAVLGPLAAASEPHSWDLCEKHAESITAPLGWELVRYDVALPVQDDDDLTALAEAVREAGRRATGLVLREESDTPREIPRRIPGGPDASRHPSARKSARAHLRVVPDPSSDAE